MHVENSRDKTAVYMTEWWVQQQYQQQLNSDEMDVVVQSDEIVSLGAMAEHE